TRELPYSGSGTNYLRAAFMQATGDVPAPRTKERDVPEELDLLITRAMATNPAERPTAEEMASTIARIFSLEMPVAQPGAHHFTPVSTTAATIERVAPADVHDAPTAYDELPQRETEEMEG